MTKLSMESLFRALADQTRLRLLNLVQRHEVCVCHLVSVLGVPQPKVSQHLACLRRAGLVSARREGKWMHYRLTEPAGSPLQAVLRDVLACLGQDSLMHADLVRLQQEYIRQEQPVPLVKIAARAPSNAGSRTAKDRNQA